MSISKSLSAESGLPADDSEVVLGELMDVPRPDDTDVLLQQRRGGRREAPPIEILPLENRLAAHIHDKVLSILKGMDAMYRRRAAAEGIDYKLYIEDLAYLITKDRIENDEYVARAEEDERDVTDDADKYHDVIVQERQKGMSGEDQEKRTAS